jgi:anti-anti-sigma factor
MAFSIKKGKERWMCRFPQRIDTAACEDIQAGIESGRRDDSPVDFDMSGVAYVSSSFLRICLLTAQKTGPKRLRIKNVSPEVKKVFKIAGLDKHLDIL